LAQRGDLRFEDDKSLMSEYLNALKARKKAIAVKQRKRIQKYRQEEAKLRGVEYKPEKPLTSVVKI
jgi:polyhydroxyalkanoate synthesis regulator phasin